MATLLLTSTAGIASAPTATRIDTLAQLPGKSPEGAGWGADGALYLSSVNTFEVLRYRDGRVETFARLPIHTLVVAAGPGELVVNGHIDVDRTSEAAMVGAGRVAVLDYRGRLKKLINVGSLPNGITHYLGHLYFCSDTNEGRIWLVDTDRGTASVWLDDPLLQRVPGDRRAGVNGVKMHGAYLYFASTARESIFRVKVGRDDRPASAIERVGSAHYADDFDIARDGSAYVATRYAIERISPQGTTTDVTDGAAVEGGPAVLLAPDGRSLYALTQGRIQRPAWGPPGQPQVTAVTANASDAATAPAIPKLLRIWLR